MRRALVASVVAIVSLTAVLGFLYPLALTGVGAAGFPGTSQGSLIHRNGRIVGSSLAAQSFTWPRYFHSRPSATEPAYNAAGTTFSNLGPTSSDLLALVDASAAAVLKAEAPYNPGLRRSQIPVDAVTPSASGIDPDISVAYARLQERRIAAVRHLPLATVRRLVATHTDGRWLGLFGEPGVNVLQVNLDLDRLGGRP